MINIPGLTVGRQLGEGGTALVARAFSKQLNRDVALKYPLDEQEHALADFQKTAQRENDLVGEIRFPGIVQIHSFSKTPPYLLLELCHGETLDKIGKVNNFKTLLNLISAISIDLEFLRVVGLIHCDLKPNNIFLPADRSLISGDKLFFLKLSDFGLSKRESEPESARVGHGTIGYAAPETMAGSTISHRSDLFSLGVIAYQLATGFHPFINEESDPVRIESRVREEIPPPVSDYRNDLPAQFSDLIDRLLSKEFSERPETAWSVCQELENLGCPYPFRKVLSPSLLVKHADSYQQTLSFLDINIRQTEFLEDVTGKNKDRLRLILRANFDRNNLEYKSGLFSFASRIYWPARLRRQALAFFSNSKFALKKEIVASAITSERESGNDIPPGTSTLFQSLLSNAFIRRMSLKAAGDSLTKGRPELTAKLYLKAGKLDEACFHAQIFTESAVDAYEIERSLQLIDRLVDFAHSRKTEFDTIRLQMIKGDFLRNSGLADEATRAYQNIVELYRDKPEDKLLAEVYRNLGRIQKSRQEFDSGIEFLNKAMVIYSRENDELEISITTKDMGSLYCVASRLPESIKYYRQALHIQRKLNAVSDASTTLHNIGSIYGMMGRLSRTVWLLNISLKIKRELGEQGDVARTLNNLGYAHQLSGNLSQSVNYLKEAVEINRRIGSKKELLSNLWNLSEVTVRTGRLSESIEFVKEGLELASELNMKPHTAHFKSSMGNILSRLGRYHDADECYNQTETIVEEINDKVLEIRLMIYRAELRCQIGDSKAASELASEALNKARQVKAKSEELSALLVLLRTTDESEHLSRARTLTKELNLDRENLLLEFYHAQFLLDYNEPEKSVSLIEEQLQNIEELQEDIELPGLMATTAEIYLEMDEQSKAKAILNTAGNIARSSGLLDEQVSILSILGSIAFRQSAYEESYKHFKEALSICKELAKHFKNSDDIQKLMNKPKIKSMTDGIKLLGQKIARKEKAGV